MTDRDTVSEAEVEAAAKVLAESPGIDAPKLPWPCWMGTARAALTAAAQVRAQAPITVKEPNDLRAVLATMKGAKKNGVNMNIWDRDIEAVEGAIAVIEAVCGRPAKPGLMPIYGATEDKEG